MYLGKPFVNQQCLICGQRFLYYPTARRDQKYCSDACRVAAYRQRKRATMSKSDVIAAFEAFMTELRTHMEGILSAVPEDTPIAQAHDEEAAEIVAAIEAPQPVEEAPLHHDPEPEPESQSDTPAEPAAPEAPPMLTHQVVA